MSTPRETKLDKNISANTDRAHHSIDRVAGATKNAENDVRASVRDGINAAKSARSTAKAALATGRAQAKSTVATFNDRASAHPGFLFAAGAALRSAPYWFVPPFGAAKFPRQGGLSRSMTSD